MAADERKDKRFYWIVMASVAFLWVCAFVLLLFPDSVQNVPLLPLILVGYVFIWGVIARMRWQICDLRRQVSKLEQKLADGAEPPKGETAKEAYSKDDDGQRRLHISRLQIFFLFVLPAALTVL